MDACVVETSNVSKSFGKRTALDHVSVQVHEREIVALLGPNGGGKTTLFRILSTLLKPSSGSVRVCGFDPAEHPVEVRRRIGVVFQSPSLDKKLTAEENLKHHGHLYGLRGRALQSRISESLDKLGIADRAQDRVETLSGGLARRVEIAKGMLSSPHVLLLDEPSTGLDPTARRELWQQLDAVRRTEGVAVLLTTHIMDEADRCDRVAILDQGCLVADGAPAELKSRVGGDVIKIMAHDPQQLGERIKTQFDLHGAVIEDRLHLETADGAGWIPRLAGAFREDIVSITLGQPTLEDVFISATGRHFETEAQ